MKYRIVEYKENRYKIQKSLLGLCWWDFTIWIDSLDSIYFSEAEAKEALEKFILTKGKPRIVLEVNGNIKNVIKENIRLKKQLAELQAEGIKNTEEL